jgi:hypothetical protein
VRDLERSYPGPKVVLATDTSLSCGLAKALLLRWGGDPRCKVIFTDPSEYEALPLPGASSASTLTTEALRKLRLSSEVTTSETHDNTHTLTARLRAQCMTPPVLATVTKPQRVMLAGDELEVYQREQDRAKRVREEEEQRKRREDELAAVSMHAYDINFLHTITYTSYALHRTPYTVYRIP